ncbi:hypothetical protein B0H16DRAFT_1493988 [Mycena metata]|uniref:BTB domain-containing protein n=1 Tax=Mycena metata TaxID=1033252 RepID=A0AAD7KGD1_9AGAR|nr:hypothetical protein B0H16DRAFT_1493988 [Mycena metata]
MLQAPMRPEIGSDEKRPAIRSEIWHSDGSVVLQVGNVQFKGPLEHSLLHSSFFRELQLLKQPPDQPTVDGCPVVELSDDLTDVEYLLKALYNPSVALPFPYIASFVRLGRKYEFKRLYDVALERLAFENPTTLKEYDALVAALRAEAPVNPRKFIAHSTTRIVEYPGVPRKWTPNPSALCIPPSIVGLPGMSDELVHLFKGISRPDGTTSLLPCEDHSICVIGRERLLKMQCQLENGPFGWITTWKPNNGCEDVHKCQTWRNTISASMLLTPSVWAFVAVPFITDQLCRICAERVGQAMMPAREKMWETLPSSFGVPNVECVGK